MKYWSPKKGESKIGRCPWNNSDTHSPSGLLDQVFLEVGPSTKLKSNLDKIESPCSISTKYLFEDFIKQHRPQNELNKNLVDIHWVCSVKSNVYTGWLTALNTILKVFLRLSIGKEQNLNKLMDIASCCFRFRGCLLYWFLLILKHLPSCIFLQYQETQDTLICICFQQNNSTAYCIS